MFFIQNKGEKLMHTGLRVSGSHVGWEPVPSTPWEYQYAPQNALSHPKPVKEKPEKLTYKEQDSQNPVIPYK